MTRKSPAPEANSQVADQRTDEHSVDTLAVENFVKKLGSMKRARLAIETLEELRFVA